jgi:hypothetical protein
MIYGTRWLGQTFTVGATEHTVKSIKVKIYRVSTPGTGTISIKATDINDYPTGNDLTSASIAGNDLATTATWYEYAVTEIALAPNTKYAVILRFPSGTGSKCVDWRGDLSSPAYAEGAPVYTDDGGSSWTVYTQYDMVFEIWGNRAKTYTLDALVQKKNLPKTATFNGLLQKTVAKQTPFDGLMQKALATQFSTDVKVITTPTVTTQVATDIGAD